MTDFARIIPTEPQQTAYEVSRPVLRTCLLLAAGLGWFLFLFVTFYPPMAILLTIRNWTDPAWAAKGCELTPQGGWRCE